ncbi:MAG TPA: hydantoinase/oxoprolinase family protein, partial [Actinomycetota bacterium]|nr:hydantoinase/oxoprolinase family protein [Actinomycetota bacterium]
RRGRVRLLDVGPRSAHIAGLPYACFAGDDELREAAPKLIAPKPGDPAEYLVLETPGGRRLALTLTCAANALGEVMPGTYAVGNSTVARNAFEIAGRNLGIGGQALAQSVLEAASTKLARVVAETTAEHSLDNPPLLGVGGGAGAVIPFLARHLGTAWSIPEDAEVISSIGDALSFVRVEIERSLSRPTIEAVSSIHREAEAAALRAGAAPSSVQIESVAVPERGALRVTATGVVALQSSASVVWSGEPDKSELADAKLGLGALLVFRSEFFSVYCDGSGDERNFAVFDRTGAITAAGRGTVLSGRGSEVAAAIDERVPALVRNYGPVAVAPAVRLVRGSNLIDLTLISKPDEAREAALAECSVAGDEEMVVLLSRS